MTERIYEKEASGKEIVKGFLLPNNRRQIGQPGKAEPEVFLEDYAFTFARGLSEKEYTGCVVGILVGERVQTESGEKFLIVGVVEVKNAVRTETVCFTEENWTQVYRDVREYFPKHQIVGWFLGGPDFLLEDMDRQRKIHFDHFGSDKILLKMDSMEGRERLFTFRDGNFVCLPGYYIYYERNVGMQNYMMRERQEGRVLNRESPVQYPAPSRHMPEYEKKIEQEKSVTGGFYRLFYATGGVLCCLAVFVIAALAIQLNEREQLKKMLNEQEVSASATRQIYEVKEGETIESICMEVYGEADLAKEIRLLNGLSEQENPEEGQKIFLP